MKRILPLVAIMLAIYTTTSAQESGSVEFGANLGYNFSTVSSGQQTNTSYRSGFNVGIAGDYFFSDRWSIKAKLIYDQKGWDKGFINLDGGNETTTNFRLNYLTVPLMANWHFGRTRNWHLNFGPYAGFLMNVKETALNTDVKNFFKSSDFGLAFGIGVNFPLSENTKLGLEYEGNSGVIDIIKNNNGTSIRNVRGSLNVGIHFMLN